MIEVDWERIGLWLVVFAGVLIGFGVVAWLFNEFDRDIRRAIDPSFDLPTGISDERGSSRLDGEGD